MIKKTALFQ